MSVNDASVYNDLKKRFQNEFQENKYRKVNDLPEERLRDICHAVLANLFTDRRVDKKLPGVWLTKKVVNKNGKEVEEPYLFQMSSAKVGEIQ